MYINIKRNDTKHLMQRKKNKRDKEKDKGKKSVVKRVHKKKNLHYTLFVTANYIYAVKLSA